jgi:tRNA-specific adenosine deaminase 3
MAEPDVKRMKCETKHIKAILSDEFMTKEVALTTVVVGRIGEMKHLSKIMAELTKKLPLPGLHHLKRVKQKEVLLCEFSKSTSKGLETEVKRLFDQVEVSTDVMPCFVELVLRQVPAHPPKLRHQYEEASQFWSSKFHPNQYWEKLYKNDMFTDTETEFHLNTMEICLEMSRSVGHKGAGLAVNPKIQRIAALATDNVEDHPLQHCPMVLIDQVAVSQNGGAWSVWNSAEKPSDWNLQGCKRGLIDTIVRRFPDVEFGAQIVTTTVPGDEEINPHDDNLGKYGPYLCTGYDLYFSNEPCIMCAMALIHSRAKRIFYHKSTSNGALGTLTKLHTVADLNHHYEVFQIT